MIEDHVQKKDDVGSAIVELLFTNFPIRDELKKFSFLKCLFFKKDEKILQNIQESLQKIAIDTHKKLIQKISVDDENRLKILLANILAIYPFLQLKPSSTILHPEKIEVEWKLLSYQVIPIELTPKILGSPILAYGLVPLDIPSFSLLLFTGTGYPTAPGFLLSLWTDFVPFLSVSSLAFSLSRKKIEAFLLYLQKLSWEKKVKLYGLSLGGSLALQTASEFSDAIDEVHAFCPAFFNKKIVTNTPISIYFRERDLVPYVGIFADPSWNIYRITSEKKHNPLLAHIRIVPIFGSYSMSPIERKTWCVFLCTMFHALVSIPIFCITTFCVVLKILASLMRR